MTLIEKILLTIGCMAIFSGCGNQLLVDQDGNSYSTKTYGNTIWMTENLKATQSKNGEPIQFFYPNGDTSHVNKFGLLYDFETACKVCPEGWRLPTNDDWEELFNWNNSRESGPFKDNQFWANETNSNSSLFSSRPAGFGNNGEHSNQFNKKTLFWSKSKETEEFIWTYIFELENDSIRKASQHPTYAFSVRCVKED
ncbi:MAG: fibrobacter succinogenes major paralogous domain-containing protein [bacterium]|nr:fibrobacter succinogenes major paralogous domain-containing protein [bacterium]